jgi:2-polyprenyl-6-methoxyphenol hydroxylase-like FAD-dependent oxidoreductase
MRKYKVLIAGAGIGGLSAASCLMKAGHQVEIYEQAPVLSEIGAGIQISANAMHVLRDLSLLISQPGMQAISALRYLKWHGKRKWEFWH